MNKWLEPAPVGATSALIEAWRGIAALMVLVHHYAYAVEQSAGLAPGAVHFMHSGVDLFFVITGYLFAPYLQGRAHMPVLPFLVRRIWRLYPLYLISLSAAALTKASVLPDFWSDLGRHMVMMQTLPWLGLEQASAFSLVYWTLPVEVAFYGLVAVVLWVHARRTREDSFVASTLKLWAWGGVSLLLWGVVSQLNYAPKEPAWVMWQAQLVALLPAFWLGMVVRWLEGRSKWSAWQSAMLAATSLAALALLALDYPSHAQNSLTARPFGAFNLFCAAAYAALLLSSLKAVHQIPLQGLGLKVCAQIGGLSYAVYLFHEWTLNTLTAHTSLSACAQVGMAFAVTLLIASLLHKWVEMPARNYGRRYAQRFKT